MRRVAPALVALVAAAIAGAGCQGTAGEPAAPGPSTADAGWLRLDAQQRCDSALELVTHPRRWPTECRWREPGEGLSLIHI